MIDNLQKMVYNYYNGFVIKPNKIKGGGKCHNKWSGIVH